MPKTFETPKPIRHEDFDAIIQDDVAEAAAAEQARETAFGHAPREPEAADYMPYDKPKDGLFDDVRADEAAAEQKQTLLGHNLYQPHAVDAQPYEGSPIYIEQPGPGLFDDIKADEARFDETQRLLGHESNHEALEHADPRAIYAGQEAVSHTVESN